jgi:hypothetical protein
MSTFSALVLSLPTRNSTVRMRVWRALKGTGCGVLRDGVYLLPRDAPAAAVFPEVQAQVREADGFAMVVDLDFRNRSQLDHARGLFDRSREYGELVKRAQAERAALPKLGKHKGEAAAHRARRALEDLEAIDFFPGEARRQAQEAVLALEEDVQRLDSPGEPRARKGRVKAVDGARYRGRTWATRKDIWIDRMASAWLIKRFIDREARFAWLESPADCPKKAVGFDFDGAEFTHVGSRITFEVLLASFGLESDAALARIGEVIHYLDAGGIPVADARGLETVLRGIREKSRNDDERATKASQVLDHLHAAYSSS